MRSVFVVQHLHVLPEGAEDTKLIGVYSTRAQALEAVDRLKDKPGFRDFSNVVAEYSSVDGQGFYVNEYPLGLDHWQEGYETVGE